MDHREDSIFDVKNRISLVSKIITISSTNDIYTFIIAVLTIFYHFNT